MKDSKFIKHIKGISTRPDSSAWKWGGSVSVLSWLLFHAFWVFRYASLLQILKQVYRWNPEKERDKDKFSKRGNIPPYFQELYFIGWLVLFLVIHIAGWRAWLLKLLCAYYMFESVVWALYYSALRRFFEERYSTYHPLEHFLILLVIIPTQALACTVLYENCSFKDALLTLTGVTGGALPMYLSLFGVFYFAVVVSIIISTFPAERQKPLVKVAVIGTGDIVRNRLRFALEQQKIKNEQITLFYKKDAAGSLDELTVYKKVLLDETRSWIKEIVKSPIVWIASPSYTHVMYLEKLINTEDLKLIVVEKPVATLKSELSVVRDIVQGEKRNKVFFLSYYLLEKALPLFYLTRPSYAYNKYLRFQHGGTDWTDDMLNVDLAEEMAKLGELRTVRVYIIEGEDTREWPYEEKYGGHKLETLVHNVLIASQFAGNPAQWEKTQYILGKYEPVGNLNGEKPHAYHIKAEKDGVEIDLLMVKGENERQCRGARLEYEYGSVFADFEKECLIARLNEDTEQKQLFKIELDIPYQNTKYLTQTDMAISCYNGDITPDEVDGLCNQIEVLEWLIDIDKHKNADQVTVSTMTDGTWQKLVDDYYRMSKDEEYHL